MSDYTDIQIMTAVVFTLYFQTPYIEDVWLRTGVCRSFEIGVIHYVGRANVAVGA